MRREARGVDEQTRLLDWSELDWSGSSLHRGAASCVSQSMVVAASPSLCSVPGCVAARNNGWSQQQCSTEQQ